MFANRNSNIANGKRCEGIGTVYAVLIGDEGKRMNRAIVLALLCSGALSAQTPAQQRAIGDGNWPREIDSGDTHIVIYQPQVDRWKDNRIESRSAVIVTRKNDPTEIFGIVSIEGRTEVDKESRLVVFENITIKDATFPSAAALKPALLQAVRDSVPSWPRVVSLDRLLADLAITQSETKAEAVPLKNEPPKILFSNAPAVLILIDGAPQYRMVEGTPYSRVLNTPALLLFDSPAQTFYLDGGQWWMTAASLNGPWTAAANPPEELAAIKAQVTKDDDRELGATPGAAPMATPGVSPPAVYVSTVPAELLVTRGEPEYAPIPLTGLLYVTNSDYDIFMDTVTQQYYTLLAGRWFRAKGFVGPWEWVPGAQLPRDFARIAPESPKGHVLASIPGTEQAREAVIANQIPQTATVRRADAKLDVRYSGEPQFMPIEGTPMEYAVNTTAEVIHAEGRYYAIQHGIWFVADSPVGPWVVADTIPAVIYTIPPSSPLYHIRYAYVYGATPEEVYAGYTPGYLGAYVSDDVVVFGTGWWYPGMFCGDFWCGWPWTWGFGFEFSYWGGGWFWLPAGHFWWYHSTPAIHRVFSEHWNAHSGAFSPAWVRGNVNVYSHWGGQGVVARSFAAPRAPAGQGLDGQGLATRPDVYAGRDGQVYQHRDEGWYRQNNSGTWQRAPANPGLERQRDSRSLGQSRQGEFQNRGMSPGVPRTAAPPRSMPAAPSGGHGGRR